MKQNRGAGGTYLNYMIFGCGLSAIEGEAPLLLTCKSSDFPVSPKCGRATDKKTVKKLIIFFIVLKNGVKK
jgi:hypothetical protein